MRHLQTRSTIPDEGYSIITSYTYIITIQFYITRCKTITY